MHSKKIHLMILVVIFFIVGCQKLVTDPGGSGTLTQTTDGVVHWGNEFNDKGLAVVQTADGGFGVVGTRYDAANQEELAMVKFDSYMDYTDSMIFGGSSTPTYNNKAKDLQQTIDGGYILVGSTMNTDLNYDMWVVKYGPDLTTKTPEWEKSISGSDYNSYTAGSVTATYNDFGNSIQQTEDGSYIVCGTIYDGDDNDIALWKISNDANQTLTLIYGENRDDGTCKDNTGTLITPAILDSTSCLTSSATNVWARVDNGLSDVGNYAQQTNDGGYIIVGSSFSSDVSNSAFDVRLIKLKSDFTVEFNNTYQIGTGYKDDEGIFVQQTSDNGYVIVGNYGASGQGQVFILKTDYQGLYETSQYYGSSQHPDVAACIRQTNDNGFIMVGSKYSQASTMEDVWVIKFSYDLAPEWDYTFGKEYSDFGTSINQTTDGGYIITGYSYSYPATHDKQSEVILIKLTSDGIIENRCQTCAHQN
jgi:hypothetical protein